MKVKLTLTNDSEIITNISKSTVDFVYDHLGDVFDGVVEKVEVLDENNDM